MSQLLDIIFKNSSSYALIFMISSIVSSYLINKNFNNLINNTLIINCIIFVLCNVLSDIFDKYLLSKITIIQNKTLDIFLKNIINTLLLFTSIHIITSIYNKDEIFTPSLYRIILLILLIASFTNIFTQILNVLIKNKHKNLIINILNTVVTLFILDYIPDVKLNTLMEESISYTIGKSVDYFLSSANSLS